MYKSITIICKSAAERAAAIAYLKVAKGIEKAFSDTEQGKIVDTFENYPNILYYYKGNYENGYGYNLVGTGSRGVDNIDFLDITNIDKVINKLSKTEKVVVNYETYFVSQEQKDRIIDIISKEE